ncbi:hypothetical protein C5S53_05465 [Methanophagales archaeon]|jgi:uncharacterized protein GlcG (DUF336 family)|nr:hypothetical protein C5S53_05465 [Methanophagales archaeon]
MDKRKKVLIAILSGAILLGALSFSVAIDDDYTSGLTLEDAKRVIAAAEEKAIAEGLRMNIAVADVGGNLVAFERMDKAWLGSIDIAINKAYTAVAFNMTTEALGAASQPEQSLFGIHASNDGKLIIFGGGIPLYRNGELVGAIGVSGSSVPNDITVAEAGEAAF